MTVTPPRTRRELFERIKAVIEHGWYDMPVSYGGTGAPGTFLEDLLGLRAGALDIPDSLGWELKWYTHKTSLLTLFHKEADGPEAIMRYMVRAGRPSRSLTSRACPLAEPRRRRTTRRALSDVRIEGS